MNRIVKTITGKLENILRVIKPDTLRTAGEIISDVRVDGDFSDKSFYTANLAIYSIPRDALIMGGREAFNKFVLTYLDDVLDDLKKHDAILFNKRMEVELDKMIGAKIVRVLDMPKCDSFKYRTPFGNSVLNAFCNGDEGRVLFSDAQRVLVVPLKETGKYTQKTQTFAKLCKLNPVSSSIDVLDLTSGGVYDEESRARVSYNIRRLKPMNVNVRAEIDSGDLTKAVRLYDAGHVEAAKLLLTKEDAMKCLNLINAYLSKQ